MGCRSEEQNKIVVARGGGPLVDGTGGSWICGAVCCAVIYVVEDEVWWFEVAALCETMTERGSAAASNEACCGENKGRPVTAALKMRLDVRWLLNVVFGAIGWPNGLLGDRREWVCFCRGPILEDLHLGP